MAFLYYPTQSGGKRELYRKLCVIETKSTGGLQKKENSQMLCMLEACTLNGEQRHTYMCTSHTCHHRHAHSTEEQWQGKGTEDAKL